MNVIEKYFGDFPYDKIGFANTTKGAMDIRP